MRIAVVALEGNESDRGRIARARAEGGKVVVVAPPAAAQQLDEQGARWSPADPPAAVPAPLLAPSVLALRAVSALRPAAEEIRFAAAGAGGWAAGQMARLCGDLAGSRLVVELAPGDEALLLPLPLGSSWRDKLFREAARQALRDAREVRGDAAARAALEAAGWQLAAAEPEPAWPAGAPPAISAIVTHHDLERYLPECLDSLRAQTLPIDIVLIDDGSRPQAREVAREQARRDPARTRLLELPGVGVARARNAGVEAAAGELVFIVDADNKFRPRCVERLAEALRRKPAAVAAAPAFSLFEDETGKFLETFCAFEPVPSTLFLSNTAGDACALHRKAAWIESGGHRPGEGIEDWDHWLRYASAGKTWAAVPEILFDYRVRGSSMFRTMDPLHRLAFPLEAASRHRALLATCEQELIVLATTKRRDDAAEAREYAKADVHHANVRAAELDAELHLTRVARAELDGALHRELVRAAELDAQLHQTRVRACELDGKLHETAVRAAQLEAQLHETRVELHGRLARLQEELAVTAAQLREAQGSLPMRASAALRKSAPRAHELTRRAARLALQLLHKK